MARKLKITITTASNTVVVQDYDSTTLEIYNIKSGGVGEYTMEQSGNVDLTNAAAKIALIHRDGTRFGDALATDFESVTINGVAATITNLSLVRDAVSPYFFSLGGGGYQFYKEVTISADQLLGNAPYDLSNNIGTGIELLPAVADTIWDWKAVWQYKKKTTNYSTGASAITFYSLSPISALTSLCVINGVNLSYNGDRCAWGIQPQMNSSTVIPSLGAGESLVVKTASGNPATLGDGAVLIKLWYSSVPFTAVAP